MGEHHKLPDEILEGLGQEKLEEIIDGADHNEGEFKIIYPDDLQAEFDKKQQAKEEEIQRRLKKERGEID